MRDVGKSTSGRTVLSFWPFMLWLVPLMVVYGLGSLGYDEVCGRTANEEIAMPLVLVSVVTFGLLAWQKRNEFALVLAVLSTGFFLREWHFAGTSAGVYAVIAFVAGWFVYRRRQIAALIKDTPVEIWLWATALCYIMSQLIARRVFGGNYLNLLPMEAVYHIPLEETTETTAHIMLAVTGLVAWNWFGAEIKGKNDDKEYQALFQPVSGAERLRRDGGTVRAGQEIFNLAESMASVGEGSAKTRAGDYQYSNQSDAEASE